ncbi:MAG TPA: YraN family protein [Sphingobacteriaceae bacterium]|nr:YraN family protein [Sphingobacteriaceae bacterium]
MSGRTTRRRRQAARLGEIMAAAYLTRRGFRVVARNVHSRYGEIDLVCRGPGDGPPWVFVEVRTYRSARFGRPELSLTPQKIHRLRRLAAHYLAALGRPGDPFRLDAVTIYWPPTGEPPQVQHWPGIG